MHCLQLIALNYFVQPFTALAETEVFRAPGSSVHFPGVNEDQRDQAKVFQWKVSHGNTENGTRMRVLQFHAGATEPSLMKKYINRVDFSSSNGSSNGSFVLHNLTFLDQGHYELFINLQNTIVQEVRLSIIDKLAKASILSNTSSLASTIALTCDVSGKPHGYKWQKDGGEISPRHWLINGNRSLIIPSSMKGDCGIYTCLAVNPISSIQADYTLTIYGIPPEQSTIIVAAIAALVFSAVAFIGLMLLCCLKRRSRQGRYSHVELLQRFSASEMNGPPLPETSSSVSAPANYGRHAFMILLFSNIVSLVAIVVALTSWIAMKGTASVSAMALIFVVGLLVLALAFAIQLWSLEHQCTTAFLKCAAFRGLLDASFDTCPSIVIAISIVILVQEIQQNNQGCHAVYLTWWIVGSILIIFLIILSIASAIWCRRNKDGNNGAENNGAENHQEQQAGRELEPLNIPDPN
ncbi:HEPACAM family member 2-like isoform X1 [Scyliorhinus canicula]|uniref:HEPACAM family member 2-like isoform X1 n=1 Tax=Scyliorhinus canicula TaxID=7830 RepID=UPI0018F4B16A|nr:HEPACAM family member 2-like isoform X1 [Scyliorhinus canicula]XP_038671402.1 HEPACAM family member 2-like isoform X1 [Scyliorhinus canicula]XP_038671403.1 HEPACAM family member 2-like isoform X1 [Scyliorhinus canicula]